MPRLDNRGSCSTDLAASSVQGPTILYKDQGMEIEETDFQLKKTFYTVNPG